MNIIYKISKKEKVNLTEDIVESSYNKANNFPFETKTSFQRDFENKSKPDERELFGESIIELGKKNNINVELIENLYNGLNTIKKRIG
jgi:2-dehydropantoate 2-reductase